MIYKKCNDGRGRGRGRRRGSPPNALPVITGLFSISSGRASSECEPPSDRFLLSLSQSLSSFLMIDRSIVMYYTTASSSSALLRASSSRLRFSKIPSSPSPSSINLVRSLSFSRSPLAAFGPLRVSLHDSDWRRSPVSLRAQNRTSSPALERFGRKISIMGMMGLCFRPFLMICNG